LRPLAAAAASPARVRSIMVSRSSWAKAAMMVSMAVPIGPRCAEPSVRLEPDAARRQHVHDGENMLGVASKAIELPDREHIAIAEMVEGRRQARVEWPLSR
jgi:hypothetical protein